MGTNYYIIEKDTDGHNQNGLHIGKRSAAGWYCWDCGTTLCIDGSSGIHQSNSGWYSCCPSCNQEKNVEDLKNSSAGRELGFNKTKYKKKTGVASCCSFLWAYAPLKFKKDYRDKKGKIVIDEYGDLFSYRQFLEILNECPNQGTWVGQEFC